MKTEYQKCMDGEFFTADEEIFPLRIRNQHPLRKRCDNQHELHLRGQQPHRHWQQRAYRFGRENIHRHAHR